MAMAPCFPPEIWMAVLEYAIEWNNAQVELLREMPERHALLRNTALVSRTLAHISHQLLFREVALGVELERRVRHCNRTLTKFIAALESLTAQRDDRDLPLRVRALHVGIGERGYIRDPSGRTVFCTGVEAGRAIELCPNLQYLDIYVGRMKEFTAAHMQFIPETVAKLATMRHVRQLHYLLDSEIPKIVVEGILVFGFLRQLLESWTQLETLCLVIPPDHNGDLDCPPILSITELRLSGVPPASVFDALSVPAHPFTRLIVVQPELGNANIGVAQFPETVTVPSGTKELHFVGDFVAYKMDLSRATILRIVSWSWKNLMEPEPEALQRLVDVRLPPSVDTLIISPDFIVIAFAYGTLDYLFRMISGQLIRLSKLVLRGSSDILETYGNTRDEIEGAIAQAFLNVTVEWVEEPLYSEWTTLPRLPLR